MARIDRVRENYEDVTERLFSDKTAFEDYLKFAGKFFKLPSAQSMTIYGTNPKAVMVADFGTWKKFNRHVKRGANSIAVLDNGGLKHYFDISQTNGSKTPYQWTLGKDTANALIDEVYEQTLWRLEHTHRSISSEAKNAKHLSRRFLCRRYIVCLSQA